MMNTNSPIKLIASFSLMLGMVSTSFANSENYPGTKQGTEVPEHLTSTINGQIVKVGEKNQYLYSYPKLNISVNPFAPMLDYFSGSLSFALTGNLALRGDVSFSFTEDHELVGSGLNMTVAAPIYFKKVYSGFFIEPGIQVGEMFGEDLTGYQVSVGWHWMFDSGLNTSMAWGMGRNLAADDCDSYSDVCNDLDTYPVFHFRVGYAF